MNAELQRTNVIRMPAALTTKGVILVNVRLVSMAMGSLALVCFDCL